MDKLRFGLVGVYLRLTKNWQSLEKVTVDEWMRKWASKRVYEQMWEPMLIGKFGKDYKDVPMSWFWARIHARTTKLGTFKGGFQAFADAFADRLRELGVGIRLSVKVSAIKNNGVNIIVTSENGAEAFDKILVTTSPKAMTYLVPDLPENYLSSLLKLKHMGAVVLVTALKHQLSEQGYYWFNLPKAVSQEQALGPNGNDGFPFLALVEHTNYVSSEHFGGEHIVYGGDYLEAGHEYFDMDAEQLMDRFAESFARINPNFTRDWVRKVWVFKADYAQPVPQLNHSQNIPAIETPLEGIYFASMSQVYPWDRGTNFAVEIGRRAARLMMEKQ